MIQKMRMKFIAIAMMAVILMLLAIFITVNVSLSRTAEEQLEGFIVLALENDGVIKDLISETEGLSHDVVAEIETKNFSVLASKNGEVIEVIYNDDSTNKNDIVDYVQKALSQNKYRGYVDSYGYGLKEVSDGKVIIVFADNSVQEKLLTGLLEVSYKISGISVVVLFILIVFFSKFITKPVEVAFEKQKRFIADSSHELKTPLSIMSANLDMLQMEIGENQRITEINQGIHRMTGLVHELLTLVRTEQSDRVFRTFNFSEMMERVILPFEVIAFENKNMIEYSIEEGVIVNGDEEGLRKMIGALMENAIKYAKENTTIRARLYIKNGNKIIEVYNEGIGVTKKQKEKIFDKFYRVDDSRQRSTGGYGIGLSIVQNVVERHKGKIIVDSVPSEYIMFKVMLP